MYPYVYMNMYLYIYVLYIYTHIYIYTRPIPILEAADDGNENPSVELASLLHHDEEQRSQLPAKMIIIRNPDEAVCVGASTVRTIGLYIYIYIYINSHKYIHIYLSTWR
jgi:hypothetical protein